jgi:iron complex outermembrane receptor protein
MTTPDLSDSHSLAANRGVPRLPASRSLFLPLFAGLLAACPAALLAAEEPSTISALKQLDVEELMNIEVTSVGRRPTKLLGTASAIQVVTQTEIRRSGATTLAEALRLIDNLQVAQRGSRGWAISARGFNTDLANKLLVMIDGRTVYTPLFSGVFWEAQDYLLEDIDRIEVISGPGGTLWGANAVNGVINIITRRASESQGLYAEAGGGSQLQSVAGLRYGAALTPSSSFRVYGKHLERDDSVRADGDSAQDDWHRNQAGFRLDSQSGADDFTLQGDFYANREQDPAGITRMRGANLLGRWSRRLSQDSDFSLQTYYDWAQLSDAVPPLMLAGLPFSPAGRLHDDLQTLDVDFQHRFRPSDSQEVVWGLGFRYTHDSVDNAPALAFLPAVRDQELYSLFAQDEIRLHDTLFLTVGSKIEHNEYTGFEFEPSARLMWQPRPTQTAWAAVSRAVRTPSRIDRDLSQGAPPYLVILRGDSQFKSEKLRAYELGYRMEIASKLTTSLSTYYNVYDDVRSTRITPVTLIPFYFANDLAGHSYGLEFAGQLQLADNWLLHGGYNLIETRLHVKDGQFDLSGARNETADPEQQVSLRSSLNLPRGLELTAGLRWVDSLRNNNGPTPGTVPKYIELDARLAWRAGEHLELSLTGQNLLHAAHPEYGFPGPDRSLVQRNVYGKIVWRR